MAKKILLFGGSGLLGTELQKLLLQSDADILVPSHAEVDMNDYSSLEKMITREIPDMIINAAALINVNELEKDPLPGWEVNTFGAAAIARILAKHSLGTAYLFISTHQVFGNEKHFYTENDAPSPVNTYGSTKAMAERLVAEYFAGRDARLYIIRTSWIYAGVRPTFVDEVAKTILAGKDFDASIDQRANLIRAADLADAIVREFTNGTRGSGIYHIVNASDGENGISRFDIAAEICRILNIPASRNKKRSSDAIFVTKRPSAVLHNTKLPPMSDWREPLRDYILAQYGQ